MSRVSSEISFLVCLRSSPCQPAASCSSWNYGERGQSKELSSAWQTVPLPGECGRGRYLSSFARPITCLPLNHSFIGLIYLP